jgi:hypothetical protein
VKIFGDRAKGSSPDGVGGSTADPNYMCTITLEVALPDESRYEAKCLQRLPRTALALISGEQVVVPVLVDPADPSRVAVDPQLGRLAPTADGSD